MKGYIEWLRIVGLGIFAAVAYGIVHDQITVRISVEYFTIGHPKVIESTDPTTLALVWGVIATWWAGLIMGVFVALASRAGAAPKWGPKWRAVQLLKPIFLVQLACGLVAVIAGLCGWLAAANGWVWLVPQLAERVPEAQHVPFLIALWVHIASYIAGAVFCMVLCWWIIRQRRAALA